METEKTVEEIKKEINAQIDSVVGKINKFDSRTDQTEVIQAVLNDIIAKVNLSKLEKAGVIAYLNARRVKE